MCLAVPGKLIAVMENVADPIFKTGLVNFGNVEAKISLALTPEAKVDDYVLVHVGMSIGIIDSAEANKIIELLNASL